MPEDKSGPVKPPVIDLSARESEGADKPEVGARPEADTKAAPTNDTASRARAEEKPRVAAEPPANRSSGGTLALGILGGGVLGLAAAYGLATAGLWPAPPADPRLNDLAQMRQMLADLPELQARVDEASSSLGAVSGRVDTLETALADVQAAEAAPGGETTAADGGGSAALAEEIAALEARIDELAGSAGATGTEDLAALQGALDTLATDVGALQAALGAQEAELATLSETVTATQQTIAAQPTDLGAAVQLPLILSGLETAFATGRPFLSELDALQRTVPEIEVPQTVLEAAGTGLPQTAAVTRELDAVLPAMLAGRPQDADASWQDTALDWFGTTLALRPTGTVDDDGPQALVGRLEAEIARRDFVAADEIMAQLPETMRAAAGALPQMVAVHADAARLIEAARREALTVATEAAS